MGVLNYDRSCLYLKNDRKIIARISFIIIPDILRLTKTNRRPRSIPQCCIPACPSSGPDKKAYPVSFFGFPSDPVLRTKWTEFSRIDPAAAGRSLKICSIHFDIDQVSDVIKLFYPRQR